MKNINLKKVMSRVLVLSMIFSTLFTVTINTSVSAYEESGIYQYEILEDNTINVVMISDSTSTEIVVPSEIDGYTVTEISGTVLSNCRKMTSLVLPNSLKEMNLNYSVTTLSEISIDGESEYLTVVDNILYSKDMTRLIYCPPSVSLESTIFTVPDTVTEIHNHAFRSNQTLTDIILSENVTSVGNYAFTSSNISSVSIGDNLMEIGTNAFSSTTNLNTITVSDKNQSFSLIDGVLYTSDLTRLIRYPVSKEETDFVIQSTVTTIDRSAFYYNAYLENVDLTCAATSIGSYAFYNCTSLKSVTLPVGITEIPSRAFYGCTALEEIEIPEGITSIGNSAFSGTTNLLTIFLPASLEEITSCYFTSGAAIFVYEGTYAEEWVSSNASRYNYMLLYREAAIETPEPTATATAVPTSTPSATPEPTATATAVPSATPTEAPTATPTLEPTETPEPTATATPEPTETPNNTWEIGGIISGEDGCTGVNIKAPFTTVGETHCLIIGKYLEDKLTYVECVEFAVPEDYSSFEIDLSKAISLDPGESLKIFLWDSLDTMQPLSDAIELEL